MIEYINEIILPYINEKRRDLKLSNEQPALLIFDNFKAQCTTSVLSLLDQYRINVALILPNCTDRLQPLDLSINKTAKDFLQGQFREWYALQVCSQIKGETETKPVDLRLSIIKPLCAKWIVSIYEHIKSNPALVSNGFKEAGIFDCLLPVSI